MFSFTIILVTLVCCDVVVDTNATATSMPSLGVSTITDVEITTAIETNETTNSREDTTITLTLVPNNESTSTTTHVSAPTISSPSHVTTTTPIPDKTTADNNPSDVTSTTTSNTGDMTASGKPNESDVTMSTAEPNKNYVTATAEPNKSENSDVTTTAKPKSSGSQGISSGGKVALGIFIPALIILIVVGVYCAYRRKKRGGFGYLTLEELGTRSSLQNPTDDYDL
ncbi:hypothetical protein LSAT2_011646 [Lamellibrachia satsuma]|nr:hypothetical protein LSAT2_011646 [Lamellibrachia satsuma]